jgi:predicted nucleic acid-binding protein
VPFVIDNSVVCGWLIRQQASAYADAIAVRLQNERATAPAIWELELANVMRTACLRQRLTAEQAQEMLIEVCTLPIEVDRQGASPAALLSIALRFGLSSYDAAYLELALRSQWPIATTDAALREAARASGVGVVE